MNQENQPATHRVTVDEASAGHRLDAFLAEQLPQFSRAAITGAIRGGHAQVDGATAKPSFKLRSGQQICFQPPAPRRDGPEPEPIPLDLLYEDEALVAVNKPAGMVVHPAKGHWSGTLTAALAHHFQQLSSVGGPTRPGIVHRLDRDTSGVILIAKTDAAHMNLAAQFEARTVDKQYTAVVRNVPDRDQDLIEQPIGVHPYQREKMAIRADHPTSRPASTRYQVIQRFSGAALVHAFPKTGRTHQIRVHLAHIGHPVLCDRLYAGHSRLTLADVQRLAGLEPSPAHGDDVLIERQALHASRIEFAHPTSGEPMQLEAPLPTDMQRLLQGLGLR